MVGARRQPCGSDRIWISDLNLTPPEWKCHERGRQNALLQAVELAVPPSVMRLPYPENLIPLWSTEGLQRLLQSLGPFERIAENMEGQGMLQCGVTSLTVALNVCSSDGTMRFTVDDLQEELRRTLQPANTFFSTSLREIGVLASRYSVAETVHACDSDCNGFRQRAAETLEASGCVIVNFERGALGYSSPFGGHCSPLAAYDPAHDEFLVMDVARKTWQPVWVPTDLLFDGMNTLDEPRGTEKHLANNVCHFDFIEPQTVGNEKRWHRGFILMKSSAPSSTLQGIRDLPWQRCDKWTSLEGQDNLALALDGG